METTLHQFVIQETWSKEENKKFEKALAIYADDTPDRWSKVAEMIPGKSISDVIIQYTKLEEDLFDIDAGLVPIPGYSASANSNSSPFVEFDHNLQTCSCDDHEFDVFRKRSNGVRGFEQERKKGVPWTEEEHRRFLLGLLKYGKGDWRNISRNFVGSKTPTQVASHAQKYYQRQISGPKDKRRPSIHDITTVNLLKTNLNRPSTITERVSSDEGVMFLGQNLSSVLSNSPYGSQNIEF